MSKLVDFTLDDTKEIKESKCIHLYLIQRNARKSTTIIENYPHNDVKELTNVLSNFKKKLSCNGAVKEVKELNIENGIVLFGDQRQKVYQMLLDNKELNLDESKIVIHGQE